MMKKLAFLLLFVAPTCALAQQITITGTVKDPNNVPFTNGSGRAILSPTNVFFTTGLTNPVPGTQTPVIVNGLDAFGRFSIVLTSTAAIDQQTSNPQWVFSFCSAPILQFGPICFTMAPLSLTSSQDITTQISATPPPVLPAAGPGGALPAPPPGTLQKANNPPSGFAASNLLEPVSGGSHQNLVGSLSLGEDLAPQGPNPYVDIRQFGARTCNPNAPPCVSGITANISSGSAVATLSSASTFINGDGVVIYGAGTASGLSTPAAPTVTSVVAQMGTGTDLTQPGATGSTTKCYKIIARTTAGGYTPSSPETCTTTGQATLGAVTVSISSCTRGGATGVTVTCTTTSATPLLVGFGSPATAEVYIGGSPSDSSFRGWRGALSATDSTHFTFEDTALNVNNGGSASSTGGTVTFFVANHLSWAPVTNAWLYYIYAGASGAETLAGVSRPQALSLGNTYTTWDDFTNLMGNYSFPSWIPTTPPTVGANNNLSATILSGAGTTTLTLSTSAGATVSGAGIRLDAGPGMIQAAIQADGKGMLYIPNDPVLGNDFVINNYCDLTPYKLSITQNGTMWVHETLALGGSGLRYIGDRATAIGSAGGGGANTWGSYPKFWTNEAVPGLYINSGFGYAVEGMSFQGNVANGVLEMLVEAGFNASFKDVSWATSTGTLDLMGYGLILRGVLGQSVSGVVMDKVSFSAGGPAVDGSAHHTGFFCNNCGDVTIRKSFTTGHGLIFLGGNLKLVEDHYNGGFDPLVSTGVGLGGPEVKVALGEPGQPIIMDTVGHPCVASFFGQVSVWTNGCGPSGYTFQSPSVTGQVLFATNGINIANAAGNPMVFDNSLSTTLLQTVTSQTLTRNMVFNVTGPGGISTGYNNDSIFVQSPPPAAPTCSVSAGGSLAIATYTFIVQQYFWNTEEGNVSPASAPCTTTSGNQTITVNWSAQAGNPKQVWVFVSGGGGGFAHCGVCGPFAPNVTSTVWSSGTTGAPNADPVSLSGASMILPGNQGMAAPAYLTSSIGGFASTATAPALTANRSTSWPDASGTIAVGGTAYLASNYTNATTTLTNVTGLSLPVSANTNYGVTCDLVYQTSATTANLEISWTGPSSPTAVNYTLHADNNSTTFTDLVATAFATTLASSGTPATATNLIFRTTMTLINGANAGTIQLQAAATGVGTITIIPGSCSLRQ